MVQSHFSIRRGPVFLALRPVEFLGYGYNWPKVLVVRRKMIKILESRFWIPVQIGWFWEFTKRHIRLGV
jgi:hypothetical protein